MKTPLKVFIILITVAFFSCTEEQTSDIKKAEWLIGTWENKTSEGSMFESWHKKNDQEFLGKSFMISEGDTIVIETIRLIEENETLYFIPTVKDQNEGKAVRFKVKLIDEHKMIFENKSHDFPNLVSYTRVSSDSLLAEISGMAEGQKKVMTFPMKRIK